MTAFPNLPDRVVPFDQATIPAYEIGRQFDEHARFFAELLGFLREVVRDDGVVKNGTIGPEQLRADTAPALAKSVIIGMESLLEDIRRAARDARQASEEAKAVQAVVLEHLKTVSVNSQSVSRISEVVQARVARLHAEKAEKDAETQSAPLATGALGPGAGGFYGVDALGAAATAQDYAQVATEWAEHMPDTIPPNILAINAITGDHWSSRWWANRSANAFGMLAWWYQGAWPAPGPPTTPLTATGQPIPPGAMYWDTTYNTMFVWNGSTWVSAGAPAKAVTTSLYYTATAGQTVFPFSVVDKNGKTFAFNATTPEGCQSLVNGVRVEPTDDFTVNTGTSTVTFLRPLRAGDLVIFDLLTPASQLAPSGSAAVYILNPITPNGVTTLFTGLTIALNGHPVNTVKNEELLVSVDGIQQQPGASYSCTAATITFSEAPPADAKIFIIWFGPTNPP